MRLLFASFAALIASTATALAGAPARPPAIADGLKDCPGGMRLPGSRTCVRFGGAVRTDAVAQTGHRLPGRTGGLRLGASVRVEADVRTPTELGPLRVYTSVRSRSGFDGPR